MERRTVHVHRHRSSKGEKDFTRERFYVVKSPTSTSTTAPASTPSAPVTQVIGVDDRELLATVEMCVNNS